MTKMNDLIEQRAIVEERRLASHTANDDAGFIAATSELNDLEKRIGLQQTIDEADRREQGRVVTGDPHFERELQTRNYVTSSIRIASGFGGADDGWVREMQSEIERRTGRKSEGIPMTTDMFLVEKRVLTTALPAGGPGGNLIATELHGEMYFDRLRAAMKVAGLGATTLSNLVGNVDIPGAKASAISGWVAENTPLTLSDLEFQSRQLRPKHVGAMTEVSRNMIMQSSPDIETLVRNDLALIIADAIDRAAIAGSGAGAEPRGILNTAGIGNVPLGTNGGAMTIDTAADLVGAVATLNAPETSRGFLTTIKARVAAMKLKDAQGMPFGVPAVFKGERVEFSSNVPSNLTKGTGTNLSAAIYGNWSDLIIGYWSAFDLLVNPYESVAYSKGNVQIRAMMTADVAVRYVESFAAAKDIIA